MDEQGVADEVGEFVGWTLHWTAGYAQAQVELAVALTRRLPMVLAALRDGQIDQARADAFADALRCVSDDVAARIATRLLPRARTWTVSELRASLRYHVDRADPGAARRRYMRRVAERDVYLRAQPDGTANLSGQGLVPHRAAEAFDRIDRIARAARAGGDVRTLAQLRADAMCDVLTGIPFALTPTTDPVTAEADATAETNPAPPWQLPQWRTESRFPTTKPDDPDGEGRPDGGGGSPDDVGGRCGGSDPSDGWPADLIPPPPDGEAPDCIDSYDYDRACLTDLDRAWVDIGCEPPGAADDETPDWWLACHPSRPAPGEDQQIQPA